MDKENGWTLRRTCIPSQSMMPTLPTLPHPTSPQRRSSQEGRKIRVAFDVTFFGARNRKKRKKRMTEAQKEYDENQMWLRSIYCQSLSYYLTSWIRFGRTEIKVSVTDHEGRGTIWNLKEYIFYEGGSLHQALSWTATPCVSLQLLKWWTKSNLRIKI